MNDDIFDDKSLETFKWEPEKVQDGTWAQEFAHFLVPSGKPYCKDTLQVLTDRGIENRLLDALVEFLPNGAVIAGGFLTTVIQEEKDAKDIDFFFLSKEAFIETVNLFLNPPEDAWAYKGYKLRNENDLKNVNSLRYITFVHKTRPAVQLLRMVWYSNPEAVIDSFDLTISQFAVTADAFYFSPTAFLDLVRKRIVLHRVQFMASTLRRLIKYSKKGYYACPGSLTNICEQIQKFNGPADANKVVYVD